MARRCCPVPLTVIGPEVAPRRLSEPYVRQPRPARLHPTFPTASQGGRCIDAIPPQRVDEPRRGPATLVPHPFYLVPYSPYAVCLESVGARLSCRLPSMPHAVPTLPICRLVVLWPHPLVFANAVFAMPVPALPIPTILVPRLLVLSRPRPLTSSSSCFHHARLRDKGRS